MKGGGGSTVLKYLPGLGMTKTKQKRLRILVVEDDSSIRNIMNDLLILENHDVVLAADGETAVEHIQNESFNLVITDLGLPGIPGFEVVREAKRLQENISTISISSWQGKETKKEADESGIDITIWKPFKFGQILEAVEKLTGMKPRKSMSSQA